MYYQNKGLLLSQDSIRITVGIFILPLSHSSKSEYALFYVHISLLRFMPVMGEPWSIQVESLRVLWKV